MTANEVKALLEKPTITPDELYVSGVLQCSRNRLYESIAAGEIASIRLGKKILVVTAPLRKRLGIET